MKLSRLATLAACALLALAPAASVSHAQTTAPDCPNGGTIRFGVEPYEDAAFEALRNHRVDAGELNSDRIATATTAGAYSAEQFPTLWKSAPIPQDPITVRGNLPAAYKAKATLLAFDFTTLPQEVQDMFKSDVAMAGSHLVPDNDSYFDEIRSLVATLNVDLESL